MNNKIITREWIHKGFVFQSNFDTVFYEDMIRLIQKWKIFLFNNLKADKGMTIGFCVSTIDEKYFSLFFAAAELGLKFVVFQRPESLSDLENYKLEIFKPMDYIVYDNQNIKSEIISKFINDFSKCSFSIEEVKREIGIAPFKDQADVFLADNKSEILLTTSSGTTDKPKLITHTHEFFYDLCKRNSKIMDFRENDKIIHIRNLHHGSSLGVFFLPSLNASSHHYASNFTNDNVETLGNDMKKYGITKISVPYNKIIDDIISLNDSFPDLTIFNLSFLQDSWIDACKKNKIKEVKSIFGCNETSGPIYMPSINSSIDTTSVDFKNLGSLLDDFYPTKIENGTLHVYLKTYDRWVSTNDKIEKIKDNFIFKGKDSSVRINDILINTEEFKDLVKQYVSTDHVVIFDKEQEKIYLGILDDIQKSIINFYEDLNKKISEIYSPLVQISKVGYVVRERFFYGIKIDHEQLRRYFREM